MTGKDYFAHLTDKERRIIVDKKTEFPFTGEYDRHFKDGLYVCRACGAALYDSKDKFQAHCGWPAFDDEIHGAVDRDESGWWPEIHSARCGGHLGHVFTGERFTEKNTRHCVNSLSMKFIPRSQLDQYLKDHPEANYSPNDQQASNDQGDNE